MIDTTKKYYRETIDGSEIEAIVAYTDEGNTDTYLSYATPSRGQVEMLIETKDLEAVVDLLSTALSAKIQ